MIFGKKVKLSDDLYERTRSAAEGAGCSSIEEFVERVLEEKLASLSASVGASAASKDQVQDIANKLKGLGYLE